MVDVVSHGGLGSGTISIACDVLLFLILIPLVTQTGSHANRNDPFGADTLLPPNMKPYMNETVAVLRNNCEGFRGA